jgi:hypothetical protein
MRRLSPATLAGVASGVLFYLHAMVPYSHAWPLVWPVLGGAAAVVLAARRADAHHGALATGARAGAVAAGVFLVMTIPTLLLLSLPRLAEVAKMLGGNGPLVMTGSMLVALAVAASFSIPGAVLGGLAGRLVARPRTV